MDGNARNENQSYKDEGCLQLAHQQRRYNQGKSQGEVESKSMKT